MTPLDNNEDVMARIRKTPKPKKPKKRTTMSDEEIENLSACGDHEVKQ